MSGDLPPRNWDKLVSFMWQRRAVRRASLFLAGRHGRDVLGMCERKEPEGVEEGELPLGAADLALQGDALGRRGICHEVHR